MRLPGEAHLPFPAHAPAAVAWAQQQAGVSPDEAWREFDAFRRQYRSLRPPWDLMGGRNMFEVWVAYVAHWIAGEPCDLQEYIRAQHNLAPEPPTREGVE